MDLIAAVTYMFRDRAWPSRAGKVALVSPIPIFGQLWAMGYAFRVLRALLRGDEGLPEADLSYLLLWDGVKVALVTLLVGIGVALLSAPLYLLESAGSSLSGPALIQALQGPTPMLVTVSAAVITSVLVVRLALTTSLERGLNPGECWSLLRAEPAIWIACAVIGWIAFEGPYALVWALPLHGDADVIATVLASTVAFTFGHLVNAHLSFQAYSWSKRSAALRAANVRYRW